MAIAMPVWTSMIVYYVEGDRGHLMTEEVGQQKYRTVVRGSCVSYLMPWEDILRQLMAHGKDKSAYSLPRPREALKYLDYSKSIFLDLPPVPIQLFPH